LFVVAINLTKEKKFKIKLNFEVFVQQISKIYLYNKKIKQIIYVKEANKQEILTIFCKTIKLEFENYIVIKYLTINTKHLFV